MDVQEILWEVFWIGMPMAVGYLFGVLKKLLKANTYKKLMRLSVKDASKSSLKFVAANTAQQDAEELVTYGFVFEYRAAGELGSTLAKLYGRDFKISTTMSKPTYDYSYAQLDTNLIVIGGPFHNAVTREFLRRMGDTLPFHYEEDASLAYTDPANPQNTRRFTPKVIDQKYYGEDYALIMNVRNPLNPEKRVIFISGCRSIGCYGGAIFLSQQLKEIKGKVKSDEYAVVVSCCGDEEDLNARPKLCACYPLNIQYTE